MFESVFALFFVCVYEHRKECACRPVIWSAANTITHCMRNHEHASTAHSAARFEKDASMCSSTTFFIAAKMHRAYMAPKIARMHAQSMRSSRLFKYLILFHHESECHHCKTTINTAKSTSRSTANHLSESVRRLWAGQYLHERWLIHITKFGATF
jgi:hypothetical protein